MMVAHLSKDLVAAALGNSIKSVAGGNSSAAQQMELPHFVRRTSDPFPPYSLYILDAKLKTRKSGVIPAYYSLATGQIKLWTLSKSEKIGFNYFHAPVNCAQKLLDLMAEYFKILRKFSVNEAKNGTGAH